MVHAILFVLLKINFLGVNLETIVFLLAGNGWLDK